MDLSLTCVLSLLFTFIFFFFRRRSTSTKSNLHQLPLPPGPRRFPLIGNLLDLGDKPHIALCNLAKLHGPIISLQLGTLTSVVISSPGLAQQVMQKHDLVFSNRITSDAIHALDHHQFSLPWLPVSSLWRSLRKVCASHIFTTRKLDSSQNLRRHKIQQLLETVGTAAETGRPINIGQVAFETTLNLMSNTIFSVDLFDPSSKTAQEFKETVSRIMEVAGKPNVVDYYPFLRKIDPQGIRRRMTTLFRKYLQVFDELYDERVRLRKQNNFSPQNDLLETLIDIIEDKTEEIDRNCIAHLVLVLFVAGSDTTSSTLEWGMAEVLRNPRVLEKARAELERVIGKGNQVEESDISRLPYLQAIIKETFRLHPVVPLLLPRKAGADVEMCGFKVPKDAQIMVNVWAIGRDESIWENAERFMPERFLGSDVDVKGTNFELIPFGAGRRICPGLPLSLRMLHLMLGSLLHSFDWKLDDRVTPENLSMEEKFGLSLQKVEPLSAIPVSL